MTERREVGNRPKPFHTGCWLQIYFCCALAPAPWLNDESVRLIKFINTGIGATWWCLALMVSAVAMAVGVIYKRPSCRQHGLIGAGVMWITTYIGYAPAMQWYSPMSVTFSGLALFGLITLCVDVQRKPRDSCA